MPTLRPVYTEGDGYRIRLRRMEEHDEPSGGWFVRAGTVLVGSRAMLDEGRPLAVIVSGSDGAWGVGPDGSWSCGDGEATLLPIYLDPMTKLFLVAFRPPQARPASHHDADSALLCARFLTVCSGSCQSGHSSPDPPALDRAHPATTVRRVWAD